MREFCLLWDIDGTLLSTHGAGVPPLEKAIFEVFGCQVTLERGKYSGFTDYEIIADLVGEDLINIIEIEKLEDVLQRYTRGLKTSLNLFPASPIGMIKETLNEITNSSNYKSFIGTGNFEPAAQVKLESVGLDEYFQEGKIFGATIARRRRVEIINFAALNLTNQYIPIVIGDAPADIIAAKKNNLDVIATPTGHHSFEDLNALIPGMVLVKDWSIKDLLCKIEMISE